MSYVVVAQELMQAAATDLAAIGSTLDTARLTAASPTVAVLAAGADEVSASIAHLFSGYGQEYQKLAGQAAAFHAQFVQNLTASAGAYASAEAASANPLQAALDMINASSRALFSRPLIGNGNNGAPGQPGEDGGI